MSEIHSPYAKGPKDRSEMEVADFEPEHFERITAPESDGALPPAPDPFEEFQVDRQPLSELMGDLPSLDGLFKPFDLESENPVQEDQPYEDFFVPEQVSEYVYEDLDTRDPEVIRTLSQAEGKAEEIVQAAGVRASGLIEAAVTEAKGLESEARAAADHLVAEARQATVDIEAAAEKSLAEAEDLSAAAEADRQEAARLRAEAEAQLAAVQDRIAGLDQERQRLEEETEARRAELEAEQAARLAELEAERDSARAEAAAAGREQGRQEGLDQGRSAGRDQAFQEFQARLDTLAALLGRLENIYQDLWTANEPMMVKLAIEAAERIVHQELAADRGRLAAGAFKACVDFLSRAHRVTCLARPQDIPFLEQAKAEERLRLGALVKVDFQPDETLGPGDLIVESDLGRLDATVKHRAAEVLDVLRAAFAEAYQGFDPPEVDDEAEAASQPVPAEEIIDVEAEPDDGVAAEAASQPVSAEEIVDVEAEPDDGPAAVAATPDEASDEPQ